MVLGMPMYRVMLTKQITHVVDVPARSKEQAYEQAAELPSRLCHQCIGGGRSVGEVNDDAEWENYSAERVAD